MSKQKEQTRNMNRQTVFANAAAGKEFWVANGHVLRNLHDLSIAFEAMDGYTFGQHVSAEKNDFARWTLDVLKQDTLAKKLSESKSIEQHQITTLKHIVGLLK